MRSHVQFDDVRMTEELEYVGFPSNLGVQLECSDLAAIHDLHCHQVIFEILVLAQFHLAKGARAKRP
jgi:hypothetical protein